MRLYIFVLTTLCLRVVSSHGVMVASDAERAVNSSQQRMALAKQNFLVGIASLGALHETNNTRCGQELEMLLQAVTDHKIWALKVLDYFGKPPKSFTWGNYFWFATPDLCDDLNQPYRISLAHSKPITFNSLIHLGLCLPKSCCPSRIQKYVDMYFERNLFETQEKFYLEMRTVDVKIPHFSLMEFLTQTGSIIFVILLITSISLPILAEIFNKSKHKLQLQHSLCRKNVKLGGELRSYQQQRQREQCPAAGDSNQRQQPDTSKWERILMCFLMSDNFATFTSLDNSNRNSVFLTSMAGLRSIVCMWITVFHVYYYALFAMSNTPFIFAKLERFATQPIMQACFYVDVFFTMSSFLLVFNFLSNTKQMQRIATSTWWENVKMFFNSLLQRYLRLTPVMIITMLLSTMNFDLVNMYSPFRLDEHSGLYCKTTWWYNLLYIHNLIDMDRICCSWTWYLACEMQYFILFNAFLYVYAKHPKFAQASFVVFAPGVLAIGWITNYINGISFEIDVINSTLNELYVKPWVRIPPYVGGAIMGWLMHFTHRKQSQRIEPEQQLQNTKSNRFNRVGIRSFWLVTFVIYIATNFMSYWRSTPSWAVALIMSLGKFVFALCIGGIIIQCSRGQGGMLNRLLSARPFLFLNKFCFSIYMLAPIIVVLMFGLRNEPTIFTEMGSGADFFAVIVLAIMSGMLLYILVELPMQRISNVLLKWKTL
ncbi:nose resistant to fluoxetine protein 6-like isoform X2 [Musca autumnalis]|uniref:nose resistant to fluoxetine protein 6-like isoform X2 n=1 Tax=Musca autumnalis TaxID=221902 RepID=UPI003CEF1EA0